MVLFPIVSTPQDVSIAWAAGLFEGEGCFSQRQKHHNGRVVLGMSVTSTDEDVLLRFQRIVNCGTVQLRNRRHAKPHWKDCWVWMTSGKKAIRVSDQLRPHLGARRTLRLDQIIAAVADSQPKPKKCEWCTTEFTPNRFARQRFCTTRCIDRAKYMRRKYGISSKAEADAREILGTIRPERKTHCPQGHKYEGDNLTIYTRPDGGKERRCKACARERYHEYKLRQKLGAPLGTC